MEAGGSDIQGCPWLHGGLKASLGSVGPRFKEGRSKGRRVGGQAGGREGGDQSFIQQMFDALSSQEPSPKAFKRIRVTTQLQNASFSLYLLYRLLAQKVCSCQYFGFLLLKPTPAFLTVNSLSSALGAKFKYPKAIT